MLTVGQGCGLVHFVSLMSSSEPHKDPCPTILLLAPFCGSANGEAGKVGASSQGLTAAAVAELGLPARPVLHQTGSLRGGCNSQRSDGHSND